MTTGGLQDKYGFLWFATGTGLIRYDGVNILEVEVPDIGLSGNDISMAADDDRILVGTRYGLYSVSEVTLEVTRINTNNNDIVRSILVDGDEGLWVGTETGLVAIDRNGDITEYNTFTCGITHNTIRCMYKDSRGYLWIGTYNGLNVMHDGKIVDNFNTKGNYKSELPNNMILDIEPYGEGDDSWLLIGTETGLTILESDTGEMEIIHERNSALSNEVIKCIFVSGDEIWMGTDFGLNVLDCTTGAIRNYFHESQSPQSLSSNVVWSIFRDNGGSIWFATQGGACYLTETNSKIIFKPVSYEYNGIRISNNIRNLYLSGDILYGSSDNGIVTINTATQETIPAHEINDKLSMSNSYELLTDSYERLWIATTGGLNIYDPKDGSMRNYTTDNIPVFKTNYIAAIKNFGTDDMFINIWGSGIYRINERLGLDPDTEIHQVTGISTDRFVVQDDKLWTINRNEIVSINILNGHRVVIEKLNGMLDGNKATSLCLVDERILYVGIRGGIIKYDTMTGDDALIDLPMTNREGVINMVIDGSGRIWGGTESTVFVLDNEDNAAIVGLGNTFPMKNMRYNCMIISDNGTLYCGGDNGYMFFDTDEIDIRDSDLPVYITTLWINNEIQTVEKQSALFSKPLPFVSEIKLRYNQHNLALGFASMQYVSNGSNRYYYKMDGIDQDWIYADPGQNRAIYSNLHPGKYKFHVSVTDSYGRRNGSEASLAIRIYPPIMLRTGFILLYIALGIVTILLLYRFSTKRMRLMNELRLARLETAHEKEINRAKIQFFTNISHEFRTPLSLIIPPLKEASAIRMNDQKLKELIRIAHNNSEKLLKLIDQLLDFRKMEEDTLLNLRRVNIMEIIRRNFDMFRDMADRMNIRFMLYSFNDEIMVNCDAEKIETVIYNLLSNAFKFTEKNGNITISAEPESHEGISYLAISVADSGIGINPREINRIFGAFYRSKEIDKDIVGSGIGLSIVNTYVEMHNGLIRVESTPGMGSSFKIMIPVGDLLVRAEDEETGNVRSNIAIDNIDALSAKKDIPTIIYAEDDPGMREYIKLSLSDKYRIITATDGQSGFNKTVEYNPDIVICDIMMPGMDGLTMSRMLKNDSRTKHIPIIALSAKTLPQDQLDGFRAGVDIYNVKPVDPEILEANIEQLLDRRRKLIEYFHNELVVVSDVAGGWRDVDKKLIDSFIELIENNISESSLTVDLISKEIGISSVHLYRRIKKLLGISPNEFIRKYRLKKAALLIKGNKGNISEIMYYVGFSSSSYFSRCFKNEFGMLPSEYKDIH